MFVTHDVSFIAHGDVLQAYRMSLKVSTLAAEENSLHLNTVASPANAFQLTVHLIFTHIQDNVLIWETIKDIIFPQVSRRSSWHN